jgi:hypothetical protein
MDETQTLTRTKVALRIDTHGSQAMSVTHASVSMRSLLLKFIPLSPHFAGLTAAALLGSTAYSIVDLNGDGWSDIWQAAYGTGLDPTADNDGDGRTNSEEYVDGTDPFDPASKRPETSVEKASGGQLRFTWPSVIGKSYRLEVSFDSGTTWNALGAPVVGTGEMVEHFIDKNSTYLGTGPLLSRYLNLGDNVLLDDVKAAVNDRVAPDETRLLASVETPQTNPNLDRYGQFIRGWIIPPANGTYVFWIAGNAATELSLSTNAASAKKKVIAFSDSTTTFREWSKYATQKSEPVELKGGKLYYFEAYQKESTGSDHVSVAWTGPVLSPDKEVIDAGYVTTDTESFGRKLAKNKSPLYRLTVSDRDTDNDGLTDYEELTVGLDPFNAKTVSRTADMATITAMFSATNVITVGAEAQRGYESEQQPAKFTFFRAGGYHSNCRPLHRGWHGTNGQDYAPLSGTVNFGVGQTSATVELLPANDSAFEPAETVTATITPDAAYEIGAPSSAYSDDRRCRRRGFRSHAAARRSTIGGVWYSSNACRGKPSLWRSQSLLRKLEL